MKHNEEDVRSIMGQISDRNLSNAIEDMNVSVTKKKSNIIKYYRGFLVAAAVMCFAAGLLLVYFKNLNGSKKKKVLGLEDKEVVAGTYKLPEKIHLEMTAEEGKRTENGDIIYEYDEMGRIKNAIRYRNDNEDLSYRYEYDELGRLTGIIRNGEVVYTKSYDDENRIIEIDSDWASVHKKEYYDEQMRSIKEVFYDSEGNIDYYNTTDYSNNISDYKSYDGDDVLQSEVKYLENKYGYREEIYVWYVDALAYDQSGKIDYKTDEDGDVIEIVSNNYDGSKTIKTMQYGDKKIYVMGVPVPKETIEIVYDSDGQEVRRMVVEGNDSHQTISYMSSFVDEEMDDTYIAREEHELIKIGDYVYPKTVSEYNKNGDLIGRHEYEYDKKGNQIGYVHYEKSPSDGELVISSKEEKTAGKDTWKQYDIVSGKQILDQISYLNPLADEEFRMAKDENGKYSWSVDYVEYNMSDIDASFADMNMVSETENGYHLSFTGEDEENQGDFNVEVTISLMEITIE